MFPSRQMITQATASSFEPSDEELSTHVNSKFASYLSDREILNGAELGVRFQHLNELRFLVIPRLRFFFARRTFLTSGCDTGSSNVILPSCDDQFASCLCRDFLASKWSCFFFGISQDTDLGCVEVAIR